MSGNTRRWFNRPLSHVYHFVQTMYSLSYHRFFLFLLPPTNAAWQCLQPYLSACLPVCNALTSESLDLESPFLVCSCSAGTSAEQRAKVHTSRSQGQGQGHKSKKARQCILCPWVISLRLKGNMVLCCFGEYNSVPLYKTVSAAEATTTCKGKLFTTVQLNVPEK